MTKLNQLVVDGVISIEDVLQFADQYRAALDQSEEDYVNHDDNHYDYNPSADPEYVIASTSELAEETYVFEGNEEGEIVSWAEYGGISDRYGDEDWTNHKLAIETVFGPDKYDHVKLVSQGVKATHHLYKKRAQ